jgi:hypothetical protein
LRKIRQVGVRIESTEGTANLASGTFVDADVDIIAYDPTFSPEPAKFERKPAQANFSPLPQITGLTAARLAFTTELKGSGTVTTAPAWGKALRACGMRELVMDSKTTGAVSGGPFVHGEIVTGGTSAATGLVFRDRAATPVVIAVLTGTFTNELITGSTSGATATISATADYGVGYWPDSRFTSDVITVGTLEDGFQKVIIGARGNPTIRATNGDKLMLELEFLGVVDPANWADFPTLSPSYDTTVPPPFKGASLIFHSQAALVFQTLSIALGNDLQLREDANNDNGAISTKVADRTGVAEFDPEMVLVASGFDFYDRLWNDTLGELEFTLGSTPGNIIEAYCHQAQIAGISDNDRGGIDVLGTSLTLHKGGVNSNGEDELVIVAR